MSDIPPPSPWGDPSEAGPFEAGPPPLPAGADPPAGDPEPYPPPGSPGNYPPYPPYLSAPPAGPGYGYGRDSGPVLAGWWYRVGATLIDGLVLFVPNLILRAASGAYRGSLLGLAVDALYVTLMLSQRGQTVGNMAVHTKVVDARTGGPIGPGKALGRWAAEAVLALLFFVPWVIDVLWPLWDRQKQTLHDKMAGTLVLREP